MPFIIVEIARPPSRCGYDTASISLNHTMPPLVCTNPLHNNYVYIARFPAHVRPNDWQLYPLSLPPGEQPLCGEPLLCLPDVWQASLHSWPHERLARIIISLVRWWDQYVQSPVRLHWRSNNRLSIAPLTLCIEVTFYYTHHWDQHLTPCKTSQAMHKVLHLAHPWPCTQCVLSSRLPCSHLLCPSLCLW